MKAPGEKPPLLSLLLRATLWMPFGLFITALWFASVATVVLAPILGTIYLCSGDPILGLTLWAVAPAAFFIARYLKRRFWEPPSSVL